MTIIPPPPPRPSNEWGTFTPRHFRNEMARRNIGQMTYSNLQTQGLNAGLRARAAELAALEKLRAKGVIPPSAEAIAGKGGTAARAAGGGGAGGSMGSGPVSPGAQAAGRTGPAGPRGWNQNPAQPIRAPRPTAAIPSAKPGFNPIGGGPASLIGAFIVPMILAPVERAGGAAAQATGRAIGTTLGIKDTPDEFEAKPGWYKRWACTNAWLSGVSDPRCQAAPPPLSTSEIAGSEGRYGDPPFTGGQSPGVLYRVAYRFDTIGTGGQTITLNFDRIADRVGPIGGLLSQTAGGDSWVDIIFGSSRERLHSSSASQGDYVNVRIVSITRVDGEPDTGGNPQGVLLGPPVERPQRTAPPPPSGPFNPEPLPASAPSTPAAPPAAPAPAPELEPSNPAPNRPPDRRAAPVPTPTPEPPIAPDGSPTGNPVPAATPANVPVGGTTTLPSGTTVTKTATGYEISVPLGDPRPLVSPRPVKTPGGETISPGETLTEEKKIGGLPWWLTSPPLVAKIPQGTKVNATEPSSFTDPESPKSPPPPSQPPTDNACRCNAPVLNRLNQLDNKMDRMLGGAGLAADGGILAYLQKMQAFAEKAWRATQMQKVLDVLTFIGVMHNVSMLSRDVGETFLQLVSQGIQAVGIRDEEGDVIDVESVVGRSVESLLRNLLGSDRYDGINEAWNKANRIVSSASAVIWTIRSISDASLDLMEWISENTGRIGNALKRWGVVGERSYPWMSESAKAQHRLRSRFSRVTDALDNAEDRLSTYMQATSGVIEIQEEVGELGENWRSHKESVIDAIPDPWIDNNPIKEWFDGSKAISDGPDVSPSAAQKG